MSKGSLFIIGADCKWEEKQLINEATSIGFDVKFLLVNDICLKLDTDEADIFYKNASIKDLFKEGRLIFRRTRGAYDKMISVALLASHWHVKSADSVESIVSNLNKLHSMPSLTLKYIRNIPTIFVHPGEKIDSDDITLDLPLIAKPACGRHGEGIEIIKTEDELCGFLSSQKKEGFILQSYLEIEEEYRVFVVGDKSLGAIKKFPEEGSKIANYAAGAEFHPTDIPREIEDESIDLCIQQQIDIGGVDIARMGEEFYLLEINRCPEFQAFSKATDVNVAKKIIQFISNI